MRSRIIALAAGLLFLASVVGVAVVSRSASSGDLPRLPFGAAGERNASMAAADMALFRPTTYKLGDGVEAPADKAAAYRLAPSASEAEKVAAALGLDGSAKAKAAGEAWTVTDGDRTLRLERSGNWSLSNTACSPDEPASSPPSKGVAPAPAADEPPPPDGAKGDGQTTATLIAPVPGGQPCGYAVSGTVTGGGVVSSEGGSATAGSSTPESRSSSSDAPPPDKPPVVCDMPACAEGQSCLQVCPKPPVPARPADLPTKPAARTQAAKILAELGFDAERGTLHIDDGYTVWSVGFEPEIEGVPVFGLGVSLAIGPKGALEWASGWVTAVAKIGDYPLASLATAVNRLNHPEIEIETGGPQRLDDSARDLTSDTTDESAGNSAGASAGVPAPDCGVDQRGPITTIDPGTPADSTTTTSTIDGKATTSTVEGGKVISDCGPFPAPCHDAPELSAECVAPCVDKCEPVTPPEPVVVTLTKVKMALTLVFAPDEHGAAYLIPAYLFSAADAEAHAEAIPVVAVIDDLLIKPQAPVAVIEDPMPAKP